MYRPFIRRLKNVEFREHRRPVPIRITVIPNGKKGNMREKKARCINDIAMLEER
ncbi:hypothetical protein WN48_00980 [Eufriesea mexicana]|uniref:Uncharacterized protein n=1 Tax=Eufriesea mexicana TaxID=516756 RepID=A0A310SGZ2_9HYME|nr:hypothetical protein WN48_00980 [Eufriesea mexicana]